jgi:hypothetical protein
MRRLIKFVAAFLLLGCFFTAVFVATAAAQQRRGGASSSSGGDACASCGSCGTCGLVILIPVAILVIGNLVAIAGAWKSFEKAGEPGWTVIVPVYNMMVMARIAGKEETYGLLCFIPVAGPIFMILLTIEFCKKFDVSGGFVVGLILAGPIFWPILGFGSARFTGGRRKRRRAVDDEDEPRRRSRREEEEDEDRPRRRRRDEDEDDQPKRRIRRDEDEDDDRRRRIRRDE